MKTNEGISSLRFHQTNTKVSVRRFTNKLVDFSRNWAVVGSAPLLIPGNYIPKIGKAAVTEICAEIHNSSPGRFLYRDTNITFLSARKLLSKFLLGEEPRVFQMIFLSENAIS